MNTERHRIVLCDRAGVPLHPITSLVDDLQITEQLDAPTSMMFGVDSSDPKIRGIHTDGSPYLDYLRRTIKYYRWERVEAEQQERFVHRFTGYVWPLEDDGDQDGTSTKITCYDPMHILQHRLCRAVDLSYATVPFVTTEAGVILRALVDRTNLVYNTGITTLDGILETTNTASVEWKLKMVNEAISEMTSRLDVAVTPLDRTDGVHGRLDIWAKRGQHRPELILTWGAPPHTAETMSRSCDPSDAVTLLIGIGASVSGAQLVSIAVDNDAANDYLHLEAVQTYSDVVDQGHLNALVAKEFLERVPPQDGVTVKPVSGILPWVDFETGDTCELAASPLLRGGIGQRTERIFGFTYGVDADDTEDVTLVTGPDVIEV